MIAKSDPTGSSPSENDELRPVVPVEPIQLTLSGTRCSDRVPNLPAAVNLLERQACNCVGKITCLRCELLELLT